MRRPARSLFVAAVLAGLLGLAVVGQQARPAGPKMADAATAFLNTLTPEQQAKAKFAYDDPHRLAWFFTPQQANKKATRKGVRFDELSAKQKDAALGLLQAGLSVKGYEQATTVMSLESVLHELEKNGANVRDPNWYFVSVFGDPSATGPWGWRIEGHHLSINMTLDKGQVVAVSPVVFGANPAEIKSGPRQGLRTLPEIEDLAKELIASLDAAQTAVAKQAKQLPEIKEGVPNAGVGEPVGLAAGKMTDAQKATLMKLVKAYADRLPADVSAAEMVRVQKAGPDAVRFAYAIEPDKKGKPYTYRVHGPTFVVEFLNVQADGSGNPGNHIHSGWRALPADFGVSK